MSDLFKADKVRLRKRLDRFDRISKNLASSNKADVKKAQKTLKSLGRYSGPIDGSQGKGTTAALNAMRKSIKADQADLTTRIDRSNKAAAQKRSDKLKASKQKAKAAQEKANSEFKKSATQTAVLATSVVGGLTYSAKTVKNLRKEDAVAVKTRNTELNRVNKQIEKIKTGKGAKTKAGNFSANTKKRLFAVADSAKKQGITKYKMPLGGGKAAILLAESVGARVLAETTFKDNELANQSLHSIATGLNIAAVAAPLTRVADKSSTPHLLNSGHITAIDEAHAIGKPTSKTPAPKSKARSVLTKSLKAVGKGTSKAVPVLGWGLAAYAIGEAAYSKFSKTGSVAKAATAGTEAGVDVLTSGAYSVTKSQAKSFYKQSPNVLVNKGLKGYAKHYSPHNVVLRTALSVIPKKHLPAAGKKILSDADAATKTPVRKVKSVKALLKSSKSDFVKSSNATRRQRLAKRANSNGTVKAHTRVVNGKRIRVKSFKRK